MRRFSVALVLSLGASAGCASRSAEVPPQPYQFYRPQPRRAPAQAPVAQAYRPPPRAVALAPRQAPPSWFPAKGRISPRWTHIVIHHSATQSGSAATFDKHHRQTNGWDELGYHFVIGNGTNTPDGLIEVGSRWTKQKHGAHCKTPDNYYNEHGIGICLVGDFTRAAPTARQFASLVHLVRFLSAQCGVDASRITTHGAITHKTQCPGGHFQLAALRRSVFTAATASVLP